MMSQIKKIQNLSLKARIILIFTIIVLIVVIALARISYLTVREIYLNQLAEQVDLLSRSMIADLNTSYLDLLVPDAEEVQANIYYRDRIAGRLELSGLEEAVIFRTDMTITLHIGTSLEAFEPLAAITLNRPEIENLKEGESFASEPFKSNEGAWYLWGFYRINSEYLLGIREQASRLARVDDLSRIFWLVGTASLLITLMAGWFMARMISRPIDNLISFSQELGQGNFDVPLPRKTRGELLILADAMDKMRKDLSSRDREKEEMLAQIAHELRNPLGGIELLTGLLEEDLTKHHLDSQYTLKIRSEIRILKDLVNEYLQYSKPVHARPERLNLGETLEEVKMSIGHLLDQKRIVLVYKSTDNNFFRFDPGHFRQILNNLLANSIEASPEGSVIEISSENSGDKLILRIRDEGQGLEPGDEALIFEPFYSRKENGIGLGLAICRKLCRENQAEINAVNNPDRGCTFAVLINKTNEYK